MTNNPIRLHLDVTLPGFLEFDLETTDRKTIGRIKRKAIRLAVRHIRDALDRYVVAGDGVIYDDEKKLADLDIRDGETLYVQPG